MLLEVCPEIVIIEYYISKNKGRFLSFVEVVHVILLLEMAEVCAIVVIPFSHEVFEPFSVS